MNQVEPFLGSYKVRKWELIVCFSIQLCPQIHSCVHACVCSSVCMQPQRAGASRGQKAVESLETGVTGGCQPLDAGIGNYTQVFYKKSKRADC